MKDLTQITDIQELKALGYDEVAALETAMLHVRQARENLALIGKQIAALSEKESEKAQDTSK